MIQGITKRERQITDPEKIRYILDTATILHLGMVDGDEPYVIPMNYGYTWEDGKLTLFLHGATKGRKLDLIRKNPKVFFCIECDVKPFESELPCQYGTTYASVMGRGMARIVEDVEEKKTDLSIFMKSQTGKDFAFTDRLVSIVSVIRIDVDWFTAKHRPLPERLQEQPDTI